MFTIRNMKIVTEDEIITDHEVVVEDDRISKIRPVSGKRRGGTVINANGGFLFPGFIDIHSDYIEHMAAPRPTCLMDFEISIMEAEKELLTHGITTMFHSLSLYKSEHFNIKPIRLPENVKKFADIIEKTHSGRHILRHRLHLRLEADNPGEIENVFDYLNKRKAHLLSFMDHSPGQGQYADFEMYKKTLKSYNGLLNDSMINEIIKTHKDKPMITEQQMKALISEARENNIAVASHDDDSIEKLQKNKKLGISISEFPTSIRIAKKAKEMGFMTLAGAPNILLGGSHSGNLSAADAINENCIDMLCSDYYPASLLHAVFFMANKHGANIPGMVKMLTANPAKAVNMYEYTGSISEGKKADLILIELTPSGIPSVTHVFIDGKLVQKTYYRS